MVLQTRRGPRIRWVSSVLELWEGNRSDYCDRHQVDQRPRCRNRLTWDQVGSIQVDPQHVDINHSLSLSLGLPKKHCTFSFSFARTLPLVRSELSGVEWRDVAITEQNGSPSVSLHMYTVHVYCFIFLQSVILIFVLDFTKLYGLPKTYKNNYYNNLII